jgi:hypothetical protein
VATQTDPFQEILVTVLVNNDATFREAQLTPSMDQLILPAPPPVSCPPAIHREPFVAIEAHWPVMNDTRDASAVQVIPSVEYIPTLLESLL